MHLSERFLRFLIIGAVATAVQYGLLIAQVEWLRWPPVPASALGYALSALLNYYLNYVFTYRSQQTHLKTLPRFAAVVLTGLSLNSVLMFFFATMLSWHYLIAQILSTVLVLIWNFTANTFWSFRLPHAAPK